MIGKNAFRFATLTAVLLLTACGGPQITDLGGSSGDDSSGTPTPTPTPPGNTESFALAPAASSMSIDLRATQDISFDVQGFNGFQGAVTVNINGLPTGVSADRASQVVTIATANGSASGKFTLTSDNTTVLPGDFSYTLDSTATASDSTPLSDTDPISLTVNPTITIQSLTAKGAGSLKFWDSTGATDFSGVGTVVHLGTATAIKVRWVKNFPNTEQHRIHGNGGAGGLSSIAGATACEDDGLLTHSAQCGNPAAGANTDETGNGNGTVFQRTLHPSNPAITNTVTYYDHLTGTPGGQPSDLPGKITIMP
jgi:hypothetical protein